MTLKSSAARKRGTGKPERKVLSAWYVRIAVAVLVAVVILLVVILAGDGARADRLRDYDEALFTAQRPFLQHFDPGARAHLLDTRERFIDGELTPDELDASATTWEEDFTAARDAVRKLDPNTNETAPTPEELIQATWFIAESLEAWRGVAGLYHRAADLRRSVAAASGALRLQLTEQLDELLAEIEVWQTRASNLHELGARQVFNLRRQWGVGDGRPLRPAAQTPGDQTPGGEQP